MKITFDGDTLNVILLINNDLKMAAEEVFNPRNAMHISRNDGKMETFFNLKKDTMVLTNTLLSITNDGYSEEDYKTFEDCKNWRGPN